MEKYVSAIRQENNQKKLTIFDKLAFGFTSFIGAFAMKESLTSLSHTNIEKGVEFTIGATLLAGSATLAHPALMSQKARNIDSWALRYEEAVATLKEASIEAGSWQIERDLKKAYKSAIAAQADESAAFALSTYQPRAFLQKSVINKIKVLEKQAKRA